MNSSVAFDTLSFFAPVTVLPYEVNSYDPAGDTLAHVGSFGSVTAARAGIVAHAGEPLDIDTYGCAVLPSIVETWFAGGTEYVVHLAA